MPRLDIRSAGRQPLEALSFAHGTNPVDISWAFAPSVPKGAHPESRQVCASTPPGPGNREGAPPGKGHRASRRVSGCRPVAISMPRGRSRGSREFPSPSGGGGRQGRAPALPHPPPWDGTRHPLPSPRLRRIAPTENPRACPLPPRSHGRGGAPGDPGHPHNSTKGEGRSGQAWGGTSSCSPAPQERVRGPTLGFRGAGLDANQLRAF